jgi:DNA-binding MarR family transcriptional regulator
MDRLNQLLGVTALAALDQLRAAVDRDVGLSEAAAGALVHLQAWPGCAVGELAGVIERSQPAAVRLADRLVERGLVERRPGKDRRTVALVLTEAGSHAADAVLTARAETLATLPAGLSASERQSLEHLLGKVVADLATDWTSGLHTCRLCDRAACRSGPGCPLSDKIRSVDASS